MKKFIVTNILAILSIVTSWACGGPGPTHNYYMMNLLPDDTFSESSKLIDAFWKKYTGNDNYYYFNMSEALEAAQRKGDHAMLEYLGHLENFQSICSQLRETWSYPTKEELAQRKITLQRMATAAATYQGTALKAQYALLYMRANMLLGNYADNIAFWQQKAENMPSSVYRDMMRNIYANALLNTGKKREAWNIYCEQGDMNSLKWSVRKFRSLAGIKTIYAQQPDAPTLRYLVQDFVNSVQETFDQGGEPDDDWVREVGANPDYAKEIAQFISFANDVADKADCPDPCMWKSATAMLHYLLNQQTNAEQAINAAMQLRNTPKSYDVARCIRLLISTKNALVNDEYASFATKELQWLDSMIKPDGDCYYQHAKERIVFIGLIPRLTSIGRNDLALALLNSMEEKYESEDYNGNYCTEHFAAIENLNADETTAYQRFLNTQPTNDLERYAISLKKTDDMYLNDLIATKLIAEGRFSEAIPLLEKIPLSFIKQQNISWYMANRDFKKPRWMGRQHMPKDEWVDGPNHGTITQNKKLTFCRDMVNLEKQYKLATGEARKQKAYDMAVRYYQASYKGDCWFLTHYGQSVCDTVSVREKNFVETAYRLLNESATSANATLRINSLYALAFDPQTCWYEYDWEKDCDVLLTGSHQYKALANLNNYVRQHPNNLPRYVMKCDVLKQFRKKK